MKCAEIMTPDPKMCVPEDSVSVAVKIMWDHDCGAVPVVRDLKSKKLVGMVTDRDIAMHVVGHANVHPSQVKVADCMSSPAVACQLGDPVEAITELMGENRVRRIPVVDESGSCVGIVSQADLLSHGVEQAIAVLQRISAPHEKGLKTSVEAEVVDEPSTAVKDEETEAL